MNMQTVKRYAVIMAGGSGERFWPLSRTQSPKHLNSVDGGECLLAQTFARVSKVVGAKNTLVITNKMQVRPIRRICPQIPASNIITEPVGRDTTAAVGLAAVVVEKLAKGAESSFAVFASDHVIHDTRSFVANIKTAFEIAEKNGLLMTIGIRPTYPSTGFGYILKGGKIAGRRGAFDVARFYEKPNLQRAEEYVASGKFFWNAGMFVWKTSAILDALKQHVPDVYKKLLGLREKTAKSADMARAIAEVYPKIERISIDFSVMECADNVGVVEADFDWDDAGSWNALARIFKPDASGNVFRGNNTCALNAHNCIVFNADNQKRITALFGVGDIIVAQTPDATLVCSRAYAEKLKELVSKLPEKYRISTWKL